MGQDVLNCRGFRIHQEEDAAGGGRKPRRNGTHVMDLRAEAGLSHVVTRRGRVSVTWSAVQSEFFGCHFSV